MTKTVTLAEITRDTEGYYVSLLIWACGERALAKQDRLAASTKYNEARNGVDVRDAHQAIANAANRWAAADKEVRCATEAIEQQTIKKGEAGPDPRNLQEPLIREL